MATVEERLAFVEGRVQEHSQMFAGLREAIVSLEQRMDRRFDHVDARFTVIEERLSGVDRRFEALEQKLDHLEQKLDQKIASLDAKLTQRIDVLEQKLDQKMAAVDAKLEAFRSEMSSHQRWLVGLQVTTMLVVLGAAFAR